MLRNAFMLFVGAVISIVFVVLSLALQKHAKDIGFWWNNFGWLIFIVLWIVATLVFVRLGWINGF